MLDCTTTKPSTQHKRFITQYFASISRFESYINRVKENMGFEIIPDIKRNCSVLCFTNLDKNEPERKFLCSIKILQKEEGSKMYTGKTFNFEKWVIAIVSAWLIEMSTWTSTSSWTNCPRDRWHQLGTDGEDIEPNSGHIWICRQVERKVQKHCLMEI